MPSTSRTDPALDSRDVSLLVPEMGEKVEKLVAACALRNLQVVPFFTLRGPAIQGRLWCQSRSAAEISARKTLLIGAGAPTIASLIDPSMAYKGRWATNCLPGLSWHQWGEATDCMIVVGGKAVWSSSLYTTVYADEAKKLGLTAGALWAISKDPVHVQLQSYPSPMMVGGTVTTWAQIEARMLATFDFGNLPT